MFFPRRLLAIAGDRPLGWVGFCSGPFWPMYVGHTSCPQTQNYHLKIQWTYTCHLERKVWWLFTSPASSNLSLWDGDYALVVLTEDTCLVKNLTSIPMPLLFWKEISKLLYSQKRTSPVFRLQSQACTEAGQKQSPMHPCEKKKQNTRTQVPVSRVIHEVKITCASVYIVQLQFQKAKKC